jgi:hypothetical protein
MQAGHQVTNTKVKPRRKIEPLQDDFVFDEPAQPKNAFQAQSSMDDFSFAAPDNGPDFSFSQ